MLELSFSERGEFIGVSPYSFSEKNGVQFTTSLLGTEGRLLNEWPIGFESMSATGSFALFLTKKSAVVYDLSTGIAMFNQIPGIPGNLFLAGSIHGESAATALVEAGGVRRKEGFVYHSTMLSFFNRTGKKFARFNMKAGESSSCSLRKLQTGLAVSQPGTTFVIPWPETEE